MSTLAEAFVKVRADMAPAKQDVKAGLTKAGEEGGKGAGHGFHVAFLKGLAGIGAAIGVVDFFKGALEHAHDAAKVYAQTAAVLKSTGGAAHVSATDVQELSEQLSRKVGIDHAAIASGENLLLTFTNIRNGVGRGNDIFNQATASILDMSAALGQDTKSSAIQLGKALNDPIKGVTALRRVGVSFTADQLKQIKTLQDTGHLMGAQKIILGELTKEFGGSAAAIATPGQKMKVAWGDLQEKIGKAVLPTLARLETFLTVMLPKAMALAAGLWRWAQSTGAVGTVMHALVATLQALYKAAVASIGYIAGHEKLFKAIASGVLAIVGAMMIWNAVTKILAVSQAILDAVLAANPVGIIILAIIGLVAAFVYLWRHSDAFRKFWIGLWHDIWGVLKAVGHWFAHDFVGFFIGAWHTITSAFDAGKRLITIVVLTINSKIIGFFSTIANGAAAAFGWIPGLGPKLRAAAAKLQTFKDESNAALAAIKDPTILLHVKIAPGQLANIRGQLVSLRSAIPGLASGGIVKAQSGGTLRVLGEGGRDEAVVPLKGPGDATPAGGAAPGGGPLIETAYIRTEADAALISQRLSFLLNHVGYG